jgi:hypothetical protein
METFASNVVRRIKKKASRNQYRLELCDFSVNITRTTLLQAYARTVEIGIVSIALIVIFSSSLFFYLQNITEKTIRDSLFEQQKGRQLQTTKSLSEHIGSDLNLVISMLDGLSNSKYLQEGQLYSAEAKPLLNEKYDQYSTIINRLFLVDKDNIMAVSLAPRGSETFLGQDMSFRDWAKQTRIANSNSTGGTSLITIFSGGFERQGIYRIFITYPIINRATNEFGGMVGASIPTIPFFSHYGNVEEINTQFLVALDQKGVILANGANQALAGRNFFEKVVQGYINYNKRLDGLTRDLLRGNPVFGVYNDGKAERLATQYPIFIQGKPTYFIQLVTPTEQIYSEVKQALFSEGLKMFSLLAGTMAAIAVLVVFLIRWNKILNKEVFLRTQELFESERRKRELEESYETMKR